MKCLMIFVLLLGVILWTSGEVCHVSLRNRGLTAVPTNISLCAQSLDLSHNLINTILNDSFMTLRVLNDLDISYNIIERLEASAFSGLSELISLRLSHNRLLLNYQAYPVTVFQSLQKLKYLYMDRNIEHGSFANTEKIKEYPTKIFRNLSTLTALFIDGLKNVYFDSGFRRMSQLRSFGVFYGALEAVLKVETIAVFLNLTIDSLSLDCNTIKLGTLKPFVHLRILALRTDNLDHSLALLADLLNRNMTSVRISNSNPSRFLRTSIFPENLYLTKNNTIHLATMCVKQLTLRRNSIVHLGKDVFSAFQHPECLESLDVGDNFTTIATDISTFLVLARFPNLKYINFSSGRLRLLSKRQILSGISKRYHGLWKRTDDTVTVPLPRSAEVINVSHIAGRNDNLPDITFMNGDNLRTLDMAYCGIQDCSFRLFGLPNLTVFNMSGFDCSRSAPNVLESLSNLEVLTARECRLAESLGRDSKHIAFRSLVRLRLLDLSDNDLITIHVDLFKPLVNLEILILANNKFSQIPDYVLALASLSHLDISSNVFAALSNEAVDKLSNFPSRQMTSFTVSMSHNPFLCTCHSIPFLQWYFSTKIHIAESHSLKCTLKNGTVLKIWKLKSEISNMKVECVSEFWLIASIVGASFFTVSIVLGIFGYRFRWNIKYWILTKCRRGPLYEELTMEQYQFDAFVGYNYQNYQWACITLRNVLETENNYSLCLHDRDFPVGVSIQQNIVDAVNSSRKVILVINRAFLTSDWCEFEIQMAGMRMVRDGRENAIIVIMMEEIPVAEMPRSLLKEKTAKMSRNVMWKSIYC